MSKIKKGGAFVSWDSGAREGRAAVLSDDNASHAALIEEVAQQEPWACVERGRILIRQPAGGNFGGGALRESLRLKTRYIRDLLKKRLREAGYACR